MFEEIDYILEGQNCERFASLYGFRDCKISSSYNAASYVSLLTFIDKSLKY